MLNILRRSLLSIFFFMSPLPPTSPLFPYTTLFRSHLAQACLALDEAEVAALALSIDDPESEQPLFAEAAARSPGDRKSTRLNSSHSQNSYAVFCLKKKKAGQLDLWMKKPQRARAQV